jgi:hypothetical protein
MNLKTSPYIFLLNGKKKKNIIDNFEYRLLLKKFNLNLSEKKLKWIISINNSIIITFTSVVMFNIKNWIFGLMISFILLIALTYSLYEITGRILKMKENKK